MIAALTALAWIAVGVFNYGAIIAEWEHDFPTRGGGRSDAFGIAMLFAVLGPIGYVAAFIVTNGYQHGWALTRPKEKRDE